MTFEQALLNTLAGALVGGIGGGLIVCLVILVGESVNDYIKWKIRQKRYYREKKVS